MSTHSGHGDPQGALTLTHWSAHPSQAGNNDCLKQPSSKPWQILADWGLDTQVLRICDEEKLSLYGTRCIDPLKPTSSWHQGLQNRNKQMGCVCLSALLPSSFIILPLLTSCTSMLPTVSSVVTNWTLVDGPATRWPPFFSLPLLFLLPWSYLEFIYCRSQ